MPAITELQALIPRTPAGLIRSPVWAAGFCVAATLSRLALDPFLGSTLWFPTYYPAALFCTLIAGWRAGVLVIVFSALAANYFFVPPRHALSLRPSDLATTAVFALAAGLIVATAALLRTSLLRLRAAHERERLLNSELQHRIKNTLTVIHAMVAMTARSRPADMTEFRTLLEGRLMALASAHDLLSSGRWEMCELPELAHRALAPFQHGGRIAIEGPDCALIPHSCVPLVLALHELATNAVKYGALSVEGGSVALTWRPASHGLMLLSWSERDGPPVAAPTRRGLGSRLLKQQKGLEAVTLRFAPTGVCCEISVEQLGPARGAEPMGTWIENHLVGRLADSASP